MALVLFVGDDEVDLEFRELRLEHLVRLVDDDGTAFAGGHAAHDEQIFVGVEFREVRERVAEANADRLVDFARARVVRLHEFLELFELFRELHVVGQINARERNEPPRALLGEILHGAAEVAGPFVRGTVLAVVHGNEGKFGEPVRHVPAHVDVAGRDGGPHRDAEHAVLVQAHRSRERRDVAVVRHFKRHAPFLRDVNEHVLDALLVNFGVLDAAEQRGDAEAVVDDDARRGAADRVHARQVRPRELQRVHDAVVMVIGIAFEIGRPLDLFGEDDFPVDQRRALAVGAAEIEPDAAAVEIAPERERRRGFLREPALFDDDDFNALLEGLLEEVVVERALAVRRVDLGEHFRHVRRVFSGKINLGAAARPEHELHDALDVGLVQRGEFRRAGQTNRAEHGGGAVRALKSDGERRGVGGFFRELAVFAVPQHGGNERGIDFGNEFGGNFNHDFFGGEIWRVSKR